MEQYLLLKYPHCAGIKIVKNGKEKRIQHYDCQKLEHDSQVMHEKVIVMYVEIYYRKNIFYMDSVSL